MARSIVVSTGKTARLHTQLRNFEYTHFHVWAMCAPVAWHRSAGSLNYSGYSRRLPAGLLHCEVHTRHSHSAIHFGHFLSTNQPFIPSPAASVSRSRPSCRQSSRSACARFPAEVERTAAISRHDRPACARTASKRRRRSKTARRGSKREETDRRGGNCLISHLS